MAQKLIDKENTPTSRCLDSHMKSERTGSNGGWGTLEGSALGGLCFPDVSEPFAGVASDLPSLDAFTDEGNL